MPGPIGGPSERPGGLARALAAGARTRSGHAAPGATGLRHPKRCSVRSRMRPGLRPQPASLQHETRTRTAGGSDRDPEYRRVSNGPRSSPG